MTEIPYGYCHCGCGEKTRIAPRTTRRFGWVKGEPLHFIHGHQRRVPLRYEVEDCGYTTPCWIWQGTPNDAGYGRIQRDGKDQRAHCYFYEQHVGPIPQGLTLDHLCRVRLCVNPDHLEPVTRGENVRRGIPFRPPQTHCKRGHEFTPENTRIGASGSRFCIACGRERDRRRYSKEP